MSRIELGLIVAGTWWGLLQPALAQDKPGPIVEVVVGRSGFVDEEWDYFTTIGGGARIFVTPRLAIGPEVAYMRGERDASNLSVTGNLTFDFVASVAGRPPRVTPFLVVGGGMFQTRESFFGDDFTHTEGAFTAGGGVRGAVGDRVTVGLDARLGWETHLRINGVVGVRLGR